MPDKPVRKHELPDSRPEVRKPQVAGNQTRTSLLVRVRNAQDSEAWAEFDGLYRPMMARFAAALGIRGADADDVVQDSMEKLLNRLRDFQYDPRNGRFRGYLKKVIFNRCATLRRGQREVPAGSGDFDRPQEREPDAEKRFIQIWEEEMMRYCLARVARESDPIAMRAFHLHNQEQLPMDRVELETGLNAKQIYKATFEIRRRLRTLWAEVSHEHEDRGHE